MGIVRLRSTAASAITFSAPSSRDDVCLIAARRYQPLNHLRAVQQSVCLLNGLFVREAAGLGFQDI
jgi:hypothetical protein